MQKHFPFRNRNIQDIARLIVLGHQKTGTTAIAALLSKAVGMDMSSDPLFFADQGKAKIVEALLASPDRINKICNKYPKLFGKEIIKDPDFSFVYSALRECFQNAKFIFIVRDPRDTIRSICNRLNVDGSGVESFLKASDMKAGNHHWELILSGQLPIIDNNSEVKCGYIENLAYRWCLAADSYLNNKNEMMLVRYEDFRLAKERTIINLAELLELPIINSISDHVDTQYQPKGNTNVDWKDFFGTKNLCKIEEICNEYMETFDYKKICP